MKKYIVTSLLAAGAVLASTLAQALPITVLLTLTDDVDPSLVYFEGSATTVDVTAADIIAGSVLVDTISFTDVTSALPPGHITPVGVDAFGDFLNGDFTAVTAFLNSSGTEIIGFLGSGMNSVGSTLGLLNLTVLTDPLYRWNASSNFTTPVSGTFTGESGIQVIPEPTSIALLGIGLLGLGFAGRKKMMM